MFKIRRLQSLFLGPIPFTVNFDGCDSGVLNPLVEATNMDERIDVIEAGESRSPYEYFFKVLLFKRGLDLFLI